jgi:hypothetical protein
MTIDRHISKKKCERNALLVNSRKIRVNVIVANTRVLYSKKYYVQYIYRCVTNCLDSCSVGACCQL